VISVAITAIFLVNINLFLMMDGAINAHLRFGILAQPVVCRTLSDGYCAYYYRGANYCAI